MRYWVYINDKVEGPYEETDLVTLSGFTPETLICTEEAASAGRQEWKKASSIFEFDEVPVETATVSANISGQNTPAATVPTNSFPDTEALLEKLNSISQEMVNLQTKLDSMQTHLDSALEQNRQLAEQNRQLAEQAVAVAQAAHEEVQQQQQPVEALAQTANAEAAQTASAEGTETKELTYPEQTAPQEDEMVIRSALDSIYGGKVAENTTGQEDSFQELLPSREQKTAEEIGQELEFIPMPDDNAQLNLQEPHEQALITTPSLDEAAKDVLIRELTVSPQEDILDQIIGEHQTQSSADTASSTAAAAGLAAVGLAAGAALAKKPTQTYGQSFEIAPDKNNPEQLETVLPADKMPQDVPASEQPTDLPEETLDLPGLEDTMKEVPPEALDVSQNTSDDEEVLPQQETSAQADESATTEDPVKTEEPVKAEDSVEAEEPAKAEDSLKVEEPRAASIDLLDLPQPAAEQSAPVDGPVAQESSSSEVPQIASLDLSDLGQTSSQSDSAEKAAEEEPPSFISEEMPSEPADLPNLDSVETPIAQTDEVAQEETASKADLPNLDELGQSQPETVEEQPQSTDTLKSEDNEIEELVTSSRSSEDGLVNENDLAAVSLNSTDELMEPMTEEPSSSQETASASADETFQQPQTEDKPEVENEAVSEAQETSRSLSVIDLAAALSDKDNSSLENADMLPSNPNDLTEIELTEGSTYLISDFVPPAQVTDDISEVMNSRANIEMPASTKEKKSEDAFQDMLATPAGKEPADLPASNVPADAPAPAPSSDTIQAKRGASLDIKTVPMVPEPGKDRLNVNDLNDVNVQHDVKKANQSTKTVIGILVGGVLLIIIYVLLGLMHILPDSINLLGGKKKAAVTEPATQSAQELLPVNETEKQEPVTDEAQEAADAAARIEEAQAKVQEFPLPNGYLLQEFMVSKHPLASTDEIAWTTTEAVEADNYSVSVKVPPENTEGLPTAYRFNYNMETGILNPTNSDAKNLLDQAYGKVQTPSTKSRKRANRRSK